MAQLVMAVHLTVSRSVVGSSPRWAEHFGFPPSAPRLGNQRPWYVQPCLCDWTYKRARATYRKEKGIVSPGPGGRFPPSFNHQVIIITGDGLRC